jgi:hypothetical protein
VARGLSVQGQFSGVFDHHANVKQENSATARQKFRERVDKLLHCSNPTEKLGEL